MPYILMHMRGDPTTMQLPENTEYMLGTVEGVADELRAAASRAIAAGIEPWRLVLDPGKRHSCCCDPDEKHALQHCRTGANNFHESHSFPSATHASSCLPP